MLRSLRHVFAAVLLVLALATLTAGPAAADTTGPGEISATRVSVGQSLTFTGGGFQPGTEAVCYAGTNRVGAVTVGPDGRMSWTWQTRMPGMISYRVVGTDATAGTRTLTAEVIVVPADGAAPTVVRAGSGGQAAAADGLTAAPALLALAVGLLLVAGGATRLIRR